MIDIIATRFREAYTWIIPPEHETHQRGRLTKEQRTSYATIRKTNDERKIKQLPEQARQSQVSIDCQRPLIRAF